jgi:hypothetical protein
MQTWNQRLAAAAKEGRKAALARLDAIPVFTDDERKTVFDQLDAWQKQRDDASECA